jgi:hypothetical protein
MALCIHELEILILINLKTLLPLSLMLGLCVMGIQIQHYADRTIRNQIQGWNIYLPRYE